MRNIGDVINNMLEYSPTNTDIFEALSDIKDSIPYTAPEATALL